MGHRQSPILGANRLKLGFFSPNCSGGMSVTKVPERWNNSWENNIRLAKLADDAGIEFLLPIARWIGYGGETDFHGSVLETLTWATGLLAHTQRVNVFATVHTAFIHPVVAAKQLATADQLGHGRLGLNVVAGWNKPEYDAFGIDLPQAHADRYALAQEWFDVVTKIWNHNGPFDWNGKHFKLKGIYGFPRPYDGVPPIMNAAGSGEGRGFAARNADFLFKIAIDVAAEKHEAALKPGDKELSGGTIEEQTEQVFANLAAILAEAGTSLAKLVKTTVFLQNLDDFQGMNTVYAAHVGDRPPARSTVEVAKLPSSALVEIEAIAHL